MAVMTLALGTLMINALDAPLFCPGYGVLRKRYAWGRLLFGQFLLQKRAESALGLRGVLNLFPLPWRGAWQLARHALDHLTSPQTFCVSEAPGISGFSSG